MISKRTLAFDLADGETYQFECGCTWFSAMSADKDSTFDFIPYGSPGNLGVKGALTYDAPYPLFSDIKNGNPSTLTAHGTKVHVWVIY